MFLEEYPQQTKPPVFENDQYAKITRLSHTYNNPNWSYQYHLHKNETEFIYIAGGKGTFSINTNFYHVSKGDILIVEKGAIHSLISDKDAPLDCWTCAAYESRDSYAIDRRKYSSFAQNILIYINENYNKKITLKLLSEHFHISADYISHEFRKIYGISPLEFRENIRNNLYFCIQKEACTFVLHASFLEFILFLHNYFSTPLKYAL